MNPRRSSLAAAADRSRATSFPLLAEMEYPLARAVALASAISLLSFGLRAKHADGAAALLAVVEGLEDQLADLEGTWRRLAQGASIQARRTRRR